MQQAASRGDQGPAAAAGSTGEATSRAGCRARCHHISGMEESEAETGSVKRVSEIIHDTIESVVFPQWAAGSVRTFLHGLYYTV